MDSFIQDLMQALDMAVLESENGAEFKFLGHIPDWFVSLYPEISKTDKPIKLGRKFLFLANFLEDAREFWQSDMQKRLKSGSWIETDTEGKQHQLEATAVKLKDKKILIIESGEYSYKERQFILSKSNAFSFDYKLLEAFEHQEAEIRADMKEKFEQQFRELRNENENLKLQIAELQKR